MTARELLAKQIDGAGFMLSQALKGIPDDEADTKVEPLMSPREQVIHLTDCYLAAQNILLGQKYEFGTYQAPAVPLSEAVVAMMAERQKTREVYESLEGDEAIFHVDDFLVRHDHYHVGQLVILHHAIDPAWDHYAIYASPDDVAK